MVDEHSERLAALLRFACEKGGQHDRLPYRGLRTFTIGAHPLLAQDYFTVTTKPIA
jgi:hypothetical protein